MRKYAIAIFILAFISLSASSAEKIIGARYPALSPDGRYIAISYLGDIFIIEREGGKTERITDHIAYDRSPIFSPDGKMIAFSSARSGSYDVFIINRDGGVPRQLTFHTAYDIASSFTPDGRYVLFQSERENENSLYIVPVTGGTPKRVLPGFFTCLANGKVSPDGGKIIFTEGYQAAYRWWRKGYRGSFSADIWLYDLETKKLNKLTDYEGNDSYPLFAPDGKSFYFTSDRTKRGVYNIWQQDIESGTAREVTKFEDDGVLNPSISADGRYLAYEHNFAIYTTDIKTGKTSELPIHLTSDLKENPIVKKKLGKDVSEFALSPDGKKIAFIIRGEVFVMASEGKYQRRITRTAAREKEVSFAPDSRTILYTSARNGNDDIFTADALTGEEKQITKSPEEEFNPRFSPDGKKIAYYIGKRKIALSGKEGGKPEVVVEDDIGGMFGGEFNFSPDSRFLAYTLQQNISGEIYILDFETKKSVNITKTGYDEDEVKWTPDGKYIYLTANHYGHPFPDFTGKYDIYLIDLKKPPVEFAEDKYDKLFEEEEKDKKEEKGKDEDKDKKEKKEKKVEIDFGDIEKRLRQLTDTNGDDAAAVISPKDNETIVFCSDVLGSRELFTVKIKKEGTATPTQLTTNEKLDYPVNLAFAPDGSAVYFLNKGMIKKLDLKAKRATPIPVPVELTLDKKAEFRDMFNEVWVRLRDYYYDENFHGVNWVKMKKKYSPLIEASGTDEDFYDAVRMMLGELNSSHMGIYPPYSPPKVVTGELGLEFEQKEGNDFFKIKDVIKDSPVAKADASIKAGDYLIAIDDITLSPKVNIAKLLNDKVGKKIKLSINSKKTLENARTVYVKPISSREMYSLRYQEWEDERKRIVEEKTKGKVAYIHMRAMGRRNLARFLKKLESEAMGKEALILDIRFNTGGNVHDQVLAALSKRAYSKWQMRGLSFTTQPTFNIGDMPIILLINEYSLSDAEMTANGFKALRLGTIVGTRTYGWLIFMTSRRLINGARFSIPFWGCYTLEGEDLETIGGVVPDVTVVNTVADRVEGRDPQLNKAIKILLEKLK
jgi:tricorn protease